MGDDGGVAVTQCWSNPCSLAPGRSSGPLQCGVSRSPDTIRWGGEGGGGVLEGGGGSGCTVRLQGF